MIRRPAWPFTADLLLVRHAAETLPARQDLAHEPDNIFGIIFAVWITAYMALRVLQNLILIYDPLQGGTISESIFRCFFGNAGEG